MAITGIEISWLTSSLPLFSNNFLFRVSDGNLACVLNAPSSQLRCQCTDASVEDVFIGVVALGMAIVSAPSHPFRFRRQVPFVGIEVRDQSRLDARLAEVRPVIWVAELRGVGNLSPPSLDDSRIGLRPVASIVPTLARSWRGT